MKPVAEMSDKEYRALGLESYSSLKVLLDSPEKYFELKRKPFEGNSATLLGTAIHHYIQGNRHLVLFASKARKATAELIVEFEAQFPDGVVVPPSYEETINIVMTNLNSNSAATRLLDLAQVETPYIGVVDGLEIKGKLDVEAETYIADIKTTSLGIEKDSFSQNLRDMHYDLQAALYQELVFQNTGIRKDFYWIVVSTREPFSIRVYQASPITLKSGYSKLKDVVERYKYYVIEGNPAVKENEIPLV